MVYWRSGIDYRIAFYRVTNYKKKGIVPECQKKYDNYNVPKLAKSAIRYG